MNCRWLNCPSHESGHWKPTDPPLTYRVTVHRRDGLCLAAFTRNGKRDAILVDVAREYPHADRFLVDRVVPLPEDGSCPRCGMPRSTCGGPTDPHE